MTMVLDFPKRGRLEETELATRRVWRSKCGRFAVVHAKSKYGLPEAWNVMEFRVIDGSAGWDIVARHRTKRAAFRKANELAGGERRRQAKRRNELAVGSRQFSAKHGRRARTAH